MKVLPILVGIMMPAAVMAQSDWSKFDGEIPRSENPIVMSLFDASLKGDKLSFSRVVAPGTTIFAENKNTPFTIETMRGYVRDCEYRTSDDRFTVDVTFKCPKQVGLTSIQLTIKREQIAWGVIAILPPPVIHVGG